MVLLRSIPIAIGLFLLASPVGASTEVSDAPPQARENGPPAPIRKKSRNTTGIAQVGKASLYGNLHGRRTASGARYDHNELTAAHRTLPLNSKARVTNLANGRSVTVKVNDRGPHRKDRVIDLSRSAAEQLGMKRRGLATVRVEPLQTVPLPTE
jgi:rare lipoprotein A